MEKINIIIKMDYIIKYKISNILRFFVDLKYDFCIKLCRILHKKSRVLIYYYKILFLILMIINLSIILYKKLIISDKNVDNINTRGTILKYP